MLCKVILKKISTKPIDFENQLKQLQEAIIESPLSSLYNNTPFRFKVYRPRENYEQILLIFQGIKLQDTVSIPIEEVHAWLNRILIKHRISFRVSSLMEENDPTTTLDTAQLISTDCILINEFNLSTHVTMDNDYGNKKHIIPGFQALCVRDDTRTDYQLTINQINNLIKIGRKRFPALDTTTSVLLLNIYLHSYTNNAIIFILTCEQVHQPSALDFVSFLIGDLLSTEGIPYQFKMLSRRTRNCFTPFLTETANAKYLNQLKPTRPIPEQFVCCLSRQIMDDPVELPKTQQVVDRSAIEYEFFLRKQNPYNRDPMALNRLTPRADIKSKIEFFILNQVRSCVNRGTRFFKNKNFDQALKNYLSCFSYCSAFAIPEPQCYSLLLNNIACTFRELNRYEEAITYFHLLLLHDLKSHIASQKKAKHIEKLADIYEKMQFMKLATIYLEQSRKQYLIAGDRAASNRIDLKKKPPCNQAGEQTKQSASAYQKHQIFFAEYCKLERETTPPQDPFVLFENDYIQSPFTQAAFPIQYKIQLNKNDEYLANLNTRYNIKNLSRIILLSTLRQVNQPCLYAAYRLLKNTKSIIHSIEFVLVVTLPENTRMNTMIEKIVSIIRKKRLAFMPNIGHHKEKFTHSNRTHRVNTGHLFSSPSIVSTHENNCDISQYAFTHGILDMHSSDKDVLPSFKIIADHSVLDNTIKDHIKRGLSNALTELDQHIKEFGATCRHPNRRDILRKLAHLYLESNRLDEAIDYYQKVIDINRTLLSQDRGNVTLHVFLGCDLLQLGKIYRQHGQHIRAFNCFRETLVNYKKGHIEEPDAINKLEELIQQLKPTAQSDALRVLNELFKNKQNTNLNDQRDAPLSPACIKKHQ